MKKIIWDNRYYIILFLLFVLVGGIILLYTEKGDVVRWVNQRHNIIASYFFYYGTYFGAELVPVICLIFLFIRIKYFFVLGAANLLASIIVRFLKRIVFSTYPRPSKFFEELGEIVNVVDGVSLHSNFSFPSGHSASGFALFFAIALCIKNKKLWAVILFFFSIAVAFSRVYLVQHFFMDIYAGAIIAFIVTLLVYFYFDTRVWYHEPWANKSLIKSWNWRKSKKTPVP